MNSQPNQPVNGRPDRPNRPDGRPDRPGPRPPFPLGPRPPFPPQPRPPRPPRPFPPQPPRYPWWHRPHITYPIVFDPLPTFYPDWYFPPQRPRTTSLTYYTPLTYFEGVPAVRYANQPNLFVAPASLGAVAAVQGYINVNFDPLAWQQQPNRTVHYSALTGEPIFLECQFGTPTLVPKRAATAEQPVLEIDGQYYQCR